jgi:PAS domain S-box-containing protein
MYKHKIPTVLFKTVFIILLLSFQYLSAAESRVVKVGGEIGYPPYSYIDKNGEPAGFAVELTREIARVMGLDVEIRLMTWDKVRKGIDDGSIDVIPGMFYSEERAEKYGFSSPFSIVSSSIFVRKNSPSAESLDDLKNKEIIIMHGEVMHDYVVKNNISNRLLLTETIEDALRLLASGKGDYALIAKTPGLYWIKELGLINIIPVGKSLEPFKNCYAFRKEDKLLLTRFNEGLNILHQTGEYNALYDKWLGVLEVEHITYRYLLKYGVVIFVPLIVILALSLLWSWMLKVQVKKATAEIAGREKILRSYIDNSPDGVFIADEMGRYLDVNPAAERITGYSMEELLSKNIPEMLPPESYEAGFNHFKKLKESGFSSDELLFLHSSGEKRWWSVDAVKLEDTRYLGFTKDITLRKESEEEIRLKNKELEAVNEELNSTLEEMEATNEELIHTSESLQRNEIILNSTLEEYKLSEEKVRNLLSEKELLLQEVHHRIKNNMNTIKGLLVLQLNAEEEYSVIESLKDAESRVQSMIMLYDRLYCNENYRELPVKDYFFPLAEEIIGSFKNRCAVEIKTDIGNFILNVNKLTPAGIIINELITNMMKYAFTGRETGVIEFSAVLQYNHVVITLSDNGHGIPESINFENSTGFGMQLVGMLTEQLGGSIRIERGAGSRFVLEFKV